MARIYHFCVAPKKLHVNATLYIGYYIFCKMLLPAPYHFAVVNFLS